MAGEQNPTKTNEPQAFICYLPYRPARTNEKANAK